MYQTLVVDIQRLSEPALVGKILLHPNTQLLQCTLESIKPLILTRGILLELSYVLSLLSLQPVEEVRLGLRQEHGCQVING